MKVVHVNLPIQVNTSRTVDGTLILSLSINGGMLVRFKLVDDKLIELDEKDQDHG